MKKSIRRDRVKKKTATVSLAKNEITVESEKKFFEDDNNYIDYFMEIGVKPDIFKFNFLYEANTPEEISENLTPQIICKFPISDKRNVVIENVMVNQVFPKGFKVIESETQPNPDFYCVVLDNQLYSAIYTRKYLACLVIYESIDKYKKLYEKFKYEDNKFMVVLRSTMRTARPKSMSIDIDENPNNNNNEKIKKWYIPKCLCIVSVHHYITKYQEILNTIYDLILSNKYPSLFLDHIIEKLIVETPKVPRGNKRFVLRFPNKDIEISEKKMNELPSVTVNLCRTFDILSINNTIEIFKYLLYETKLIFFSENLFDLTNTILSFLILLNPFKYQFQIVSVLSKDLYNYAETISPFIFGINEKYSEDFFSKNKISIEDTTICVIDIDNNVFYVIAPGGKIDCKDYPEMPKKLKKKFEEKLKKNAANGSNSNSSSNNSIKAVISGDINNLRCSSINYKKKNSIEYDINYRNEQYQLIFYKIMINILKDYPKYLSKDYSVNKDISMSIKDMIDLKSYVNSFNGSEKYFYQRIFNSQMFMEFIYKRMMPKNSNEKVEVLFFEEKIKEKSSTKMLFGKSKLLEQNVLVTSKDYDYDKIIEVIDLRPNQELRDKLNSYLLERKNYILKECLNKGFSVNIDDDKKGANFYYYLFPTLLSEKLFILNAEIYKTPTPFYKDIENINTKIVNKSYLKFIQNMQILKNSEAENDLYLCYIIIWSLTMWYTEDKEKDYRFFKMLEMIENIEEHEIKIFEIIFKNLVEYSEDENIILLYKKFIHLGLNPSWEMFSLVSKIIKKKQNANRKKNLLLQDINAKELITKLKNDKNIENENIFHQRTLKYDESESIIFSNTLTFYAYFKCEKCKSSINIGSLYSNLSSIQIDKDKNGHEILKCRAKGKNNKICDGKYEPKIKFRFGEELFNQKDSYNLINKRKTSMMKEFKLLFPNELKQKLLQIVADLNKDKFDLISFRYSFPNVYWSLIFYFDLNNIDKSFMLPYTDYDSNIVFEDKLDEVIVHKQKNEKNTKNNNIDLKTNENFKIKNFFLKNSNKIKKYDTDNLCIQTVYSLGLINNLLYSYKNTFDYEENIGYNELPLIPFKKQNFSPVAKRSSVMIFMDDNFQNLLSSNSSSPKKRKSELNIVFNFSSFLNISRNEVPIDNHILIKKKNPLEDRIFEFESSVDSFDSESDDEDSDDIADTGKKISSKFVK